MLVIVYSNVCVVFKVMNVWIINDIVFKFIVYFRCLKLKVVI